LVVSPNPVEGKLFITKDADVIFTKIEVVNIMGEVVMTINNPSETIDLASLSIGNYFIRFYTNSGYAIRNIIKK
jgi:hypothetical protein